MTSQSLTNSAAKFAQRLLRRVEVLLAKTAQLREPMRVLDGRWRAVRPFAGLEDGGHQDLELKQHRLAGLRGVALA